MYTVRRNVSANDTEEKEYAIILGKRNKTIVLKLHDNSDFVKKIYLCLIKKAE